MAILQEALAERMPNKAQRMTNRGQALEKNGDLEKNPLWQGFSSGLPSSVVPEDLEFRAQVCSPWMQDVGKPVLGQTNCLSSTN